MTLKVPFSHIDAVSHSLCLYNWLQNALRLWHRHVKCDIYIEFIHGYIHDRSCKKHKRRFSIEFLS